MYTGNPFALLDKQTVTGVLKNTGSHDVDRLSVARTQLESVPKVHKLLGLAVMVVGALMTLTIVGAVANLATIDAAVRS